MTTYKPFHDVDDMPVDVGNMVYADEHDQVRHFGAIQSIAKELDRPMHEVAGLYEEILTRMRKQARIEDYLPVLVSKHVKAACRRC